jgi:hypothetical protein
MTDKPIAALAYAPVVSADPTSPEAILARNSKQIDAQSKTDSYYDTVLERFSNQTSILSGIVLAMSLLCASLLFQKTKRR